MTDLTDAVPQDPVRRYSNAAVTFHWVTVILVLAQVALGFAFASAEGPQRGELFTWHKTVGVLIVLTVLGRLFYRLRNPPPPYPPDLPRWERVVGTWNHRVFYALLILVPLTGLIAVSGGADGPTTRLAFGIPFPVIPGIGENTGETFGGIHEAFVFLTLALVAVHALAALKHRFVDRIRASGRMPPFGDPKGPPAVIGQGSAARAT